MSGALVGFALVFVLTAWASSAALGAIVALAGGRPRGWGPAGERRLSALTAVLPLALAAVLTATLAVHSAAGQDHCADHDHHAHLCVAHAQAWLDRPWALALVGAAATVVVLRLGALVATVLRAHSAVTQLRRASARIGDVRLVESPRPFCFVAGLWRPQIYASTAAWHGLDADEREAMLAHERAHVRHRDLAARAVLHAITVIAAPFGAGAMLRRWDDATERLRDRDAADAVGDPAAVAGAMVRMCRLGAPPVASGALGFTGARTALEGRVGALLAEEARGDRVATALAIAWLALVTVATLAAVTLAEPLHHGLESLLG